MTRALLDRFGPDAEILLRKISEHVSDEMLEEISKADYGEDAGEHLEGLRKIRDTGVVHPPLEWCPGEVLELIRWSEPEDPTWKPGRTGEIGHWMRAFCCAALLRTRSEDWSDELSHESDSTVVQLVLSLYVLPTIFNQAAVRFLAWLLLQPDVEYGEEQVCGCRLSLLWLALQSSLSDDVVLPLAEWILQNAETTYDDSGWRSNCGIRDMVTRSLKKGSWQTLAQRFLDLNLITRSAELRMAVALIGDEMLR